MTYRCPPTTAIPSTGARSGARHWSLPSSANAWTASAESDVHDAAGHHRLRGHGVLTTGGRDAPSDRAVGAVDGHGRPVDGAEVEDAVGKAGGWSMDPWPS